MKVSQQLWAQILKFREHCRTGAPDFECVAWSGSGYRFSDKTAAKGGETGVLVCRDGAEVAGWTRFEIFEDRLWLHASQDCDSDLLNAVRLYIPICLAPLVSPSETFIVVHMAQSIDGRVATNMGNSQWIGNAENLTHAHRLRALVDGVLVGGTTARLDKPGLDVRHVSGPNPARIFLSDSFSETDALPKVDGMQTILLRSKAGHREQGVSGDTKTLVYDQERGRVDVGSLLAGLRTHGIQSILLEGGPKTFRTFFEAGAVDWVQIHIAPMIIGSGRPVLRLSEIAKLDDAVPVKNPFYTPMGDAILMSGQL